MKIKYKFKDPKIDRIFGICQSNVEEMGLRIIRWNRAGFFKKIWLLLEGEKPDSFDGPSIKHYAETMKEIREWFPYKKIVEY